MAATSISRRVCQRQGVIPSEYRRTAALISQNRRGEKQNGRGKRSAQQRFFSFLPLGRLVEL